MDISLLRCKSLISKDRLYHCGFRIFLSVKTHTFCVHIYTLVDTVGTFKHMGSVQWGVTTAKAAVLHITPLILRCQYAV